MKKISTIILGMLLTATASAAIPTGYYTGLNGKTTSELKTALHNIIYDHTLVSSYSALPEYFKKTDVRPGGNAWWEMYSNNTFSYPSFSGMNREHCVPKSWWGGSDETPAYTDLNHLYPSEMKANSAKSNYPLGVVATASFDNGVSKVGYAVSGQGGGASKVFEPDDQYKGDFARTYFYVATCYQNLSWKYEYMMQNGTYPTLTTWAINLLLQWHRQDPVSQKEIDRNEVVYSFQNNRNPFIDYPQLAEHIWGNKKAELFYTDATDVPTGTPSLVTPAQSTSLDFGEVAIGDSKTLRLQFKGDNLTGTMSLALSGNDKAMFSLADTEIQTSLINSADGYWTAITYKPTALGEHSTKLIVYDGGIEGSRGITLTGKCLEEPRLGTLTALPATSISSTGYTANWESSQDEFDYYLVTRTRLTPGSNTVEEIETEENYLEITDWDGSQECYSVQQVRLGFKSDPSNVIFVESAGISGVEAERRFDVIAYPGWVRFVCPEPLTDCVIYDITGKEVKRIPLIENNQEMTLPYGVYFVTANGIRRPVKIAVR